jgi:hypothetical protein
MDPFIQAMYDLTLGCRIDNDSIALVNRAATFRDERQDIELVLQQYRATEGRSAFRVHQLSFINLGAVSKR